MDCVKRDIPGRRIAQAIIAEYKPESVTEMQAALFNPRLNGELESYLGYKPNSREEKEIPNQISKITDYVLEEQQNWQNRTLAPFYSFLFVDYLFVPIKRDYETQSLPR